MKAWVQWCVGISNSVCTNWGGHEYHYPSAVQTAVSVHTRVASYSVDQLELINIQLHQFVNMTKDSLHLHNISFL